jgi:hypothetical protein
MTDFTSKKFTEIYLFNEEAQDAPRWGKSAG